jgi:hypothetical protein
MTARPLIWNEEKTRARTEQGDRIFILRNKDTPTRVVQLIVAEHPTWKEVVTTATSDAECIEQAERLVAMAFPVPPTERSAAA